MAAKAPVSTKLIMVTIMIFPALFRLLVPATAPAIEAKTIGTTIQNIIRMNKVPRNAIEWEKPGASAPVIAPDTMANSKIIKKR